jgi:hypothetical protein
MNCATRQKDRITEVEANLTAAKFSSFCADIETDSYDTANLKAKC